jgi:hypothetical protein
MKRTLILLTALCGLSTSAIAGDSSLDSSEDRGNLMIEFDKNKDSVLDTKELGKIKTMKPKAHATLVNYCKLLKANPGKFGAKPVDLKGPEGKPAPKWVCSDKRIASNAIKGWIKNHPKPGGATGDKAPPTRAGVIKAIDLNKDKLIDQPEAQKMLATYPKMHASLIAFCADVPKAPAKYGVKLADIRHADGKTKPGWACNNKRIGAAALNKWIVSGAKP